ncbi:Alpha/Beta hydrolase protein [Fennellomyces sp. T-0311]|nr:Alpha/Beta hydrolase protein [Fennellomyces sp. T-0311]
MSKLSFGAAEALLRALDLYRLGDPYGIDKLHLYNQGQPRVGNDVFARYVVSTKIPYQRVVNEHDLTTHSPPQFSALGIYMHAGQELWTNNSVTYACTNGIEADKCSNTVTSLSMTDHITYFGVKFAIARP